MGRAVAEQVNVRASSCLQQWQRGMHSEAVEGFWKVLGLAAERQTVLSEDGDNAVFWKVLDVLQTASHSNDRPQC